MHSRNITPGRLYLCSLATVMAAAFLAGCSGSSGGSGSSGNGGSSNLYPVSLTIGTTSTETTPATGEITNPSHLITLANGDIVATDLTSDSTMVYDPNGNFIENLTVAGAGNGQANEPEGLCTDSQGNIYIVDSDNGRIVEFNSSFQFVRNIGEKSQMDDPEDVAVDSSGNIFLVDDEADDIVEYNAAGNLVQRFGQTAGQFELLAPIDISISPAGQIYVVDMGHNRIVVFNDSGVGVTTFGGPGSTPGLFNHPSGSCFDSAGNYYVRDVGNGSVQEFNSKNVWLFTYQIENPSTVTAAEDTELEGRGVFVATTGAFKGDICAAVKSKMVVVAPHV